MKRRPQGHIGPEAAVESRELYRISDRGRALRSPLSPPMGEGARRKWQHLALPQSSNRKTVVYSWP
jgi:hypothetical protein